MVFDLNPGIDSSYATPLAAVNGRLFFGAEDAVNGYELWATNGTESGTYLVKDIDEDTEGSFPTFLGVIRNELYFAATDPVAGTELWKTDGSEVGTIRVRDIRPGPDGSVQFGGATTALSDRLYFFADDGVSGVELWSTDGTEEGTQLVIDLNPGSASSVDSVLPVRAIGSGLAFGGTDDKVGHELWYLDLSQPDVTAPTSRVQPLSPRATSLSINVSAVGNDPSSSNMREQVSGIAEYDLYVADGSGPYTKFATVPATNPQTTFVAQSNHTYFFRSVARDNAGNSEVKPIVAESKTFVPDLSAPESRITTLASSTPQFSMTVSGRDFGGGRIQAFRFFVTIDGGAATQFAEMNAGPPNTLGNQQSAAQYRAIVDGNIHQYSFYSVGIDQGGNVESATIVPDQSVTIGFAVPASLNAIGIDVQRGQTQRSYIRNVDVAFNTEAGLQSVLDTLTDGNSTNNRLRLTRFANDGSGSGVDVSLTNKVTKSANTLAIDFGVEGIGGNRLTNVGNGYYRLSIDNDGNGTFDRDLFFYRLLGDTNSDRVVDNVDLNNLANAISRRSSDPNFDVDGNGLVDLRDRSAVQRESKLAASNRTILGSLPLND